nr:hypothetical protein [Clostridium aestuarii]
MPSFITLLKNSSNKTKVFLIHTENVNGTSIGTRAVAENLMEVLKEKKKGINVQLIPSDKSDIKEIIKVIKKIQRLIEKDNSECLSRKAVLIDYTSGTKIMSALFYNKFKELRSDKYMFTYIDDNSEHMILDDGDKIRKIPISDIEKEEKVAIEDISRIHGYKIANIDQCIEEKIETERGNTLIYLYPRKDEKIKFINKRYVEVKVDSILLLNYKLYLYEVSSEKEKSKCKMELFILKDKAEKIGGGRSKFYYKCKANDKGLKALKNDIKTDYEYEMDKRLRILNKEFTIEDEIKKLKIDNKF